MVISSEVFSQVIQIDEARIRDHLGEMVRGTVEETLNAIVCAENSIRIDLVTESLNVREEDCAAMLLPRAGHIAVQVEDPT